MASQLSLDAREQVEDLKLKLMEVLTCPLSIPELLKQAYTVISRMLEADYTSIDLTQPDQPIPYDWMVLRMPDEGFAYEDVLTPEDPPRSAEAELPPMMAREARRLSRQELERSVLFQRCHALGRVPGHGMAVMMKIDQDWHDGFLLHRDPGQSFTERERELLQRVTPLLAMTVRTRRREGEERRQWRWMLEEVLRMRDTESLLLVPPDRELMRTAGATALLEAWFPDGQQDGQGLPRALAEHVARLSNGVQQDIREFERADHTLRVTFISLQVPAGRRWLLMMKEIPPLREVPEIWRGRLTKREVQVVQRLLQGWENKTIADDLKCSEATVKKHLQRIYDKLGVDTRAMVQSLATRL